MLKYFAEIKKLEEKNQVSSTRSSDLDASLITFQFASFP